MMPVNYPLSVDFEDVAYTSPTSEGVMTIASMYNVTNNSAVPTEDITFMFSTVPSMLWILLAMTYFIFIAIFVAGHRLLDSD